MGEELQTSETPSTYVPDGPTTMDPKELKKRFDQVKSDRSSAETVWREIAAYFAPVGSSSGFLSGGPTGENTVNWTAPDVWDSTAIDAAEKLIAMIHGNVTSPALRWYGLGWRDEELKEDIESQKWLDKVADISWQTLQDSDFNTEIACAHGDLVRYGNAVIVEEVRHPTQWKGVDFEAIPLAEAYFEPDSVGGIEFFYRPLSWSAVQVLSECRKRQWTCPTEIEEEAKSGNQITKRYPLAFVIFPRYDAQAEIEARLERNVERARVKAERARRQQGGGLTDRMWMAPGGQGGPGAPGEQPPGGGGMALGGARVPASEMTVQANAPMERELGPEEPTYPLAPHMRPWGYCYIRLDTGERLGAEGGYYEMPAALARWAKTSGSVWGHGKCHVLLPTVKYTNGWMETEHQAAAKAVDPNIYTTERGLLSDHDSTPGGITVARSKDDVWTLKNDADPQWANLKLEELREMIRRGLHNDELTLKDSPAMTAQEVRARYEIMQRILGSTLARIENELLSPIIKITIGHLLRAKQLPAMPPKVAEKYAAGTLEINIEYQGPLARSQRTDEVAAIERVIALAAAWINMGIPVPVVMAKLDVLESFDQVAKRLGVPAALLKDKDAAKAEVEKFFQAQARAQEAATKKTEGEAQAAAASARASEATAMQTMGAVAGGPALGGVRPVPAMPTPVVSPAYAPTAAPTP